MKNSFLVLCSQSIYISLERSFPAVSFLSTVSRMIFAFERFCVPYFSNHNKNGKLSPPHPRIAFRTVPSALMYPQKGRQSHNWYILRTQPRCCCCPGYSGYRSLPQYPIFCFRKLGKPFLPLLPVRSRLMLSYRSNLFPPSRRFCHPLSHINNLS